jgi:predicted AlkP superfamily phosphohydrolase/phosphomutase
VQTGDYNSEKKATVQKNKFPLLVIGLDGATLDLIRPWAHAGHLPTLARLMQTGITGELESTLPPVTSPAWPSFVTGKNPGRHGVFDFIRPNAGSFDMVNASQIDGRMIWEYLSDAGLRVGVLNVPITYPPRPVNGYLVPGLLSPDQGKTTFPPDFLAPYAAELGAYRLTPRIAYKPGNEAAFLADIFDLIDTQTRYALRLARDHPADFMLVHFLATDIAQHALWKHHDAAHPAHEPALAARFGTAICQVYARLDAAIAQLSALMPTASVLVMSDHGFGPLHRIINLNNFFIERGLMALKPQTWVRARAWAFRRGLTPAAVWKIVERMGLQNLIWRVSKQARNQVVSKFLGFEDVDWSRTLAYSMGHVGQVYLNLRGREPHGIVAPDEYAAVRAQVIAALSELRDPATGQALVEQIIPREKAASGPYLERGPDLHIMMDGYRTIAFPLFAADGKIISQQIRGDSGSHRRSGVLIAAGPVFQCGQTVHGARIIDLAPTLLHALGLPVPEDMDGQVLQAALAPAYQARPVAHQSAAPQAAAPTDFTPDEQAEVEDRLRALGYLG